MIKDKGDRLAIDDRNDKEIRMIKPTMTCDKRKNGRKVGRKMIGKISESETENKRKVKRKENGKRGKVKCPLTSTPLLRE